MNNKLKGLAGLGILAVSLFLFTASPSKTNANNRVVKYSVYHNGHYLCLPAPAVEAHLREHEDDSLLGQCYSDYEPTLNTDSTATGE